MKHNVKKLCALLLCLVMALSLAACAPQGESVPEASEAPEVLTVTDMEGRQVAVPAEIDKIVCLSASATEIVFALGMGEKVVGADVNSNYPEEALALPRVGDYNGPNVEAVLALEPDVIFAGTGLQEDAVAQLSALGAAVVVSEATSYGEIGDSIELTAKVLGADAAPILENLRAAEEAAAQIAASAPTHPKVYFCVGYGEYGDYSCGKGAFITDMLAMVGADCVTKDIDFPWPTYTVEQIIADDPDIILVSGDHAYADGFTADTRYQELRAVKEGRVYAVDADITSRPGPRVAEALGLLAELLHGEN